MAGKLGNSNKKDGFRYEMNFFNEALKRGLDVFIPAGDYLPQDCIIQNSEGKIYKVQVKGTNTSVQEKQVKKIPRYRLSTGKGRKGKSVIDCNDCDILVGYVAPLDIMYLIPCGEILGVSTWLYPDDPKTKSRLEKFRENWSVFDN